MRNRLAILAIISVIGCDGGAGSDPEAASAAADMPVPFREVSMDLEAIQGAAFADVNGDGRDDLVAIGLTRVMVFPARADGTLSSEEFWGLIRVPRVTKILAADFDRNGCEDLILEADGNIYRVFSDAEGPRPAQTILVGVGACIIGDECLAMDTNTGSMIRARVADAPAVEPDGGMAGIVCRQEPMHYDSDGLLDIVRIFATEYDPSSTVLEICLADRNGGFFSAGSSSLGEWFELVTGDVDDNGTIDALLVGSDPADSWEFNTGAIRRRALDFQVRVIADIDGNGSNDLIGWSDTQIEVLGASIEVLPVANAYFLATGDPNGDGRLDLLVFDDRTTYQGVEPYFIRE